MAISNWDELKKAATDGYSDAILCRALVETIERSNRPGVIQPLASEDAGFAARLLINSAGVHMHMVLTRAYAPVRRGDRHLRAAINYLKNQPGFNQQQDMEKRRALKMAVAKFDLLAMDRRLVILKHMRDKMIAHWAVPEVGMLIPRYSDLFGFTKDTAQVWELLCLGAGSHSVPVEEQVELYKNAADRFWRRWENPST